MFHYFVGDINIYGNKVFLINNLYGIEVYYNGIQKSGSFYLYPYLDDNKKSIFYFAFDSIDQKIAYEELIKINGVGYKTAFQIVKFSKGEISKAVEDLDVKFFSNIPGIGAKTAKKILLELKDSFKIEDINSLDIDKKLYDNIIASLKGLGYNTENVKSVLKTYKGQIDKNNLGEVIKWIISQF